MTSVELLPIQTPEWVTLPSGVEVTAWPLLDTDGQFIVASGREALAYADALGAELTSAAEEDEIWSNASVRIDPITHWPASRWPSMERQSHLIYDAIERIGARPGPRDVVAGTGKVWTRDTQTHTGRAVHPGFICNYGWHVSIVSIRLGKTGPEWNKTPCFQTSTGLTTARVLQPLSSSHNLDHRNDYSQQVRLRRKS